MTHQAMNLALKAPDLALPVLVLVVLSAAVSASFYIAWMITAVAFFFPGALGTVLYVVGARDPAALPERLKLTLSISIGFSLVAFLALVIIAHPLLSIFGSHYADSAVAPLRILALASVLLVVKHHFVAVSRVKRRIKQALPVVWGGGVLQLVLAGAGAEVGGLTGLSFGWLAAVSLEALAMSPVVVGGLRRAPIGSAASASS